MDGTKRADIRPGLHVQIVLTKSGENSPSSERLGAKPGVGGR
ncbi:YwbE family protein [Exiguobacterium sp. MER 193]|nr:MULTISPECIES: YwbE family protein [unclassified Exiguobacterium]MCM3279493.1 YwbE family protein [Exiguobacterium sp. MER 193]